MGEGIGAEGCFERLLIAGWLELWLFAEQRMQHRLRQIRNELAIAEQCPRDLSGLE